MSYLFNFLIVNYFSDTVLKDLIKFSKIFDTSEIDDEKIEKSLKLLKSIISNKDLISIYKMDGKHNSSVDIEQEIFDSVMNCMYIELLKKFSLKSFKNTI